MTTLTARPAPRPGAAVGRALQYVLIGLLALFCVVPFGWLLLTSIDADPGSDLQVPTPTGENYLRFLTDTTTPRLLVNSLVIAVGATALTLALAVLGGYALSRFRFPGRRAFLLFVLIIRVVPPPATIVPLYLLMVAMGLDDGYLGLILVEAAAALPVALWLLKGTVDAIPVELEEAAWVDGAGRLATVRAIVLPLVGPGLGAAAMFTFTAVWGDFLTPLVLLQDQERYPLSIGLFRAFTAFNQVDYGLLTAAAVLYLVPPTVLYLLVRRHLFRATLTGAVKG